ncbi:hypothetical protein [Rhizobium sp. NXC14]|uniref:hypothetical protein n=1 Tax=Rhizobium sp. NXC14 TaxID=1981173 RepID=UPI0012F47CD4|nr:hypothetical protein [Rhizobium sp. NXC14]
MEACQMASRAGGDCRFFPVSVGDLKKRKVAIVTLLTPLGKAAKDMAIGSIIGRD